MKCFMIPIVFWVYIISLTAIMIFFETTRMGLYTRAVGSNELAVRNLGVDNDGIKNIREMYRMYVYFKKRGYSVIALGKAYDDDLYLWVRDKRVDEEDFNGLKVSVFARRLLKILCIYTECRWKNH